MTGLGWVRPSLLAPPLLFWCAPIWWVPYKNTSDLHLSAAQLLAGNSFFIATVVFLCGTGVLIKRRGAGTSKDHVLGLS